MKKLCIIFLTSIIIILAAVGVSTQGGATPPVNTEYLRIHIRADSNEREAQAVKYLVKDEVVAYLTPLVAEYETRLEAVLGVESHLRDIESVAKRALERNGFSYGAKANLKTEAFPTRIYEDCTLPAGEYLALIIELGAGAGDNWWCVVYPPLCFTSGNGNIVYKSKILEIVRNWKK
ncbi:MAG: stage II sporulation protein R [Clostridia bacterium]|nr:stage II sporulation protein R [Clostridia bacterium]